MLARIRKSAEEKDEGFTLIELLVVIIIIGILAAIAVPTFLNQRKKGYDAASKSTLRNAATAQESYQSDYSTYAGTGNTWKYNVNGVVTTGTGVAALAAQGYNAGSQVTLEILRADTQAYCMKANHVSDPNKIWYLDSSIGEPTTNSCLTVTTTP